MVIKIRPLILAAPFAACALQGLATAEEPWAEQQKHIAELKRMAEIRGEEKK